MPKKPEPAAIVDDLRRWQQEGESLERGLRERRAKLLAELGIIDRSLATFGARRAARTPKAAPAAGGEKPAPGRSKVVVELEELRPFWGRLKEETRALVQLRARGEMPSDIAMALKVDPGIVSKRLYDAMVKLRAARQAGEKPEQDAGSDNDEEPDGEKESTKPGQSEPPPVQEMTPAAAAAPELTDEQLAEFDRTPLMTIRRKAAPNTAGDVRAKTIAPRKLTRDEKRLSELLVYPPDVDRPVSRQACQEMRRPCPFVSCSHHLYLDVNPQTGAIKLNFPHLEVWELAETCSLDVADKGGITLEEVGAILNLTRERIRQVEVRGLEKLRDVSDGLGVPPEQRLSPAGTATEN